MSCLLLGLTHQGQPASALASRPVQNLAAETSPGASAQPKRLSEAVAPVRLEIPALAVRTALLSLGQTETGALEVPADGPDYDKAGWYRFSPVPGDLGPAVITGHVDSAARGPSVFHRLGRLQRGDTVRVIRSDRSVAVFTVDAVRRFAKAAFPTQLVYGDTPAPALRLITCGGRFDRRSGHYQDNIVVTATLVAISAT